MPQWLAIGISGVTCGGKTTLAHALHDFFVSKRNSQLGNSTYILNHVQLISQDDYFLPKHDIRHTWVEKLSAINFELLSSLDMKRMLLDIAWIMKGDQQYITNDGNTDNTKFHFTKAHSDFYNTTPKSTTANQQKQLKINCAHITKPQILIKNHSFNQSEAVEIKTTTKNPQDINNIPPSASIIRINSQLNPQLEDNKINILIIEGFLIYKQPELLKMCNIKLHLHIPYEKCFERRQKRTYDPPDVVGYFEMCVWPHYEKYFTEFRKRKDINFLNGEMCKEKILKHSLLCIYQYLEEHYDVTSCPPPYKFLGIPSIQNNLGNTISVTCSNNISEK